MFLLVLFIGLFWLSLENALRHRRTTSFAYYKTDRFRSVLIILFLILDLFWLCAKTTSFVQNKTDRIGGRFWAVGLIWSVLNAGKVAFCSLTDQKRTFVLFCNITDHPVVGFDPHCIFYYLKNDGLVRFSSDTTSSC